MTAFPTFTRYTGGARAIVFKYIYILEIENKVCNLVKVRKGFERIRVVYLVIVGLGRNGQTIKRRERPAPGN